jgi:hypothetical protein
MASRRTGRRAPSIAQREPDGARVPMDRLMDASPSNATGSPFRYVLAQRCDTQSRGESSGSRHAPVAQRIEQLPSKQSVGGSSPPGGAHSRHEIGNGDEDGPGFGETPHLGAVTLSREGTLRGVIAHRGTPTRASWCRSTRERGWRASAIASQLRGSLSVRQNVF